MVENKIQPISPPISEQEVDLLKRTFKGNEYLLKILRGLFFGFDIKDEDKQLIKKVFASEELRTAIRRKTFPMLKGNDVPIGQIADFWMGTEMNVLGATRDAIYQVVSQKQKVFEMFTKAFNLLENPFGEKVDLDFTPNLSFDPLQVELLARNLYMKSIETGLSFIKTISEMEETKPAEVQEKRKKDSAK
jgi:hypothetical protein